MGDELTCKRCGHGATMLFKGQLCPKCHTERPYRECKEKQTRGKRMKRRVPNGQGPRYAKNQLKKGKNAEDELM